MVQSVGPLGMTMSANWWRHQPPCLLEGWRRSATIRNGGSAEICLWYCGNSFEGPKIDTKEAVWGRSNFWGHMNWGDLVATIHQNLRLLTFPYPWEQSEIRRTGRASRCAGVQVKEEIWTRLFLNWGVKWGEEREGRGKTKKRRRRRW